MKLFPEFLSPERSTWNVHVHVACDQVGNLRGVIAKLCSGMAPPSRLYGPHGNVTVRLFRRPPV